MKHHLDFANKEMACLEAEVVSVMQERDACVEKAEQLLLEVQSLPRLSDESKKLRERMSPL